MSTDQHIISQTNNSRYVNKPMLRHKSIKRDQSGDLNSRKGKNIHIKKRKVHRNNGYKTNNPSNSYVLMLWNNLFINRCAKKIS